MTFMRMPYHFNRYTLTEKIALGGTAEVYRAVLSGDKGFSKTFAIKCLHPSWCESGEIALMLADEARVLSHLQHQTIAQVFEFGHFEGRPYLVMEFVDGIDLSRLITGSVRKETPIPEEHAFYIIGQVLVALDFAHRSADENGRPLCIVHRDISPSNILLSWNGEVKVTDFGIAKGMHRSSGTAIGQLRGKYSYMAPEQARGMGVDARSDIFACGIVLFEMLSAQRLFYGETDIATLEKVKNARLPRDAMDKFPPALVDILEIAMSADAANRYQTAADMLSAVEKCAGGAAGVSSSIALSKFLKKYFCDDDISDRRKNISIPFYEQIKTAVLDRNGPCDRRRRAAKNFRTAGNFLILASMLFLPPASVVGKLENAARENKTEQIAEKPAGQNGDALRKPLAKGSVVVDSVPSGVSCELFINKESRRLKTPFKIDDIEIGESLDGLIKFTVSEFNETTIPFNLSRSNSTFTELVKLSPVKFSNLHIQARPWGIVDIPGFVSKRETPVSVSKMKDGRYSVSVNYPPNGKRIKKVIELHGGESKRCLVDFEDKATLFCK